ncbi:MAG: hypothetical protein ACRDKJ_14420 [Actinomycetota bacterium]
MQRAFRLVAGILLVIVASTACALEPSDLGETEERYLERLEGVLRPLRETTATFRRLFQDTDSRTRFTEDLKRVPASARMVSVFRDLDEMEPPPRFSSDQRRLMRTLAEMVPPTRTAQQLARDDEFVRASAAHARVTVLYQKSLLEYTSRFCIVAATSAAERDLCDPAGILPGAGYGERLHGVLARASAEFTPRGFFFVGRTYTNSEVAEYLTSVGPTLVDEVERARDEIRRLVPPDEFAADQRVLEEYFTDISRISANIAKAAVDDPDRLLRLFPESRTVVSRARSRLSEDIRPAVAVWFFPSAEEES